MDRRLQTPLHYLCRAKYCTPDLIKAALVGHPDAGTFRGGNKVNHEIHRLGTLSKSESEAELDTLVCDKDQTAHDPSGNPYVCGTLYQEDSTVMGCTGLHYLCRNREITSEMLQAYIHFAKDAASLPSIHNHERIPLHLLANNPRVDTDILAV